MKAIPQFGTTLKRPGTKERIPNPTLPLQPTVRDAAAVGKPPTAAVGEETAVNSRSAAVKARVLTNSCQRTFDTRHRMAADPDRAVLTEADLYSPVPLQAASLGG